MRDRHRGLGLIEAKWPSVVGRDYEPERRPLRLCICAITAGRVIRGAAHLAHDTLVVRQGLFYSVAFLWTEGIPRIPTLFSFPV
jgi:hypothetical protein